MHVHCVLYIYTLTHARFYEAILYHLLLKKLSSSTRDFIFLLLSSMLALLICIDAGSLLGRCLLGLFEILIRWEDILVYFSERSSDLPHTGTLFLHYSITLWFTDSLPKYIFVRGCKVAFKLNTSLSRTAPSYSSLLYPAGQKKCSHFECDMAGGCVKIIALMFSGQMLSKYTVYVKK